MIYTQDASFNAEFGYTYDWVEQLAGMVPGTQTSGGAGREFTRSRYSF